MGGGSCRLACRFARCGWANPLSAGRRTGSRFWSERGSGCIVGDFRIGSIQPRLWLDLPFAPLFHRSRDGTSNMVGRGNRLDERADDAGLCRWRGACGHRLGATFSAADTGSRQSHIDNRHRPDVANGCRCCSNARSYNAVSFCGCTMEWIGDGFSSPGHDTVVSSQRAHGADFVVRLLRGMVLGRFSFAAFCFSLMWTLPRQSAEVAFMEAAFAAVVVQWASRRLAAIGR